MDSPIGNEVDAAPATRRDWVRAALWIGAIVIAIVAGWILVLTSMCGCTMPAR